MPIFHQASGLLKRGSSSLLASSASHVLASLCSAEDRKTGDLLERFYPRFAKEELRSAPPERRISFSAGKENFGIKSELRSPPERSSATAAPKSSTESGQLEILARTARKRSLKVDGFSTADLGAILVHLWCLSANYGKHSRYRVLQHSRTRINIAFSALEKRRF